MISNICKLVNVEWQKSNRSKKFFSCVSDSYDFQKDE